MSINTLYKYVSGSTYTVTDEIYDSMGSDIFQLGTVKRAFKGGDDLVIVSGVDTLVEGLDYTVEREDTNYTDLEGYIVYTGIQLINEDYYEEELSITYEALGSYTDPDIYLNLLPSTIEKTASYVILDDDGYTRIEVDTTAGDVTITLPTKADNLRRQIEIAHTVGGTNKVIISPDGADANTLTNDGLSAIWLPKVGDFIKLQESADSGKWEVLNERITSQLRLDAYSGYGSTDTKIMRFTNVTENVGNMFSENHVSGYSGNAKGLEITINRSGKYSFAFCTNLDTGEYQGLTLNSAALTTSLSGINDTTRLAQNMTQGAGDPYTSSYMAYFSKGDIIRPHTNGGAPATTSRVYITVSYLGN